MPEGDSLHRIAALLGPALVGEVLTGFEGARLRPPRPRLGETIDAVEAKGKHLLIVFSGGIMLHTHLGMTGSWQLARPDQRWRKPVHLARAVVRTEPWVAVCFAAPTVRLERRAPQVPGDTGDTGDTGPSGLAEPLAHLGPDLCRPNCDLDEAVDRMGAFYPTGDVPIIDVLLDQRVAAGIGNVYKSEVLWACRLHPLTRLRLVDLGARGLLMATAHRQLAANVRPGRRTTVGPADGSGRLAVYRRHRQPCLRCHTPIDCAYLGQQGRSTYWCPRCQPAIMST